MVARKARAWVDGVEVSRRCYEADDVEGYALCFVEDKNGKLIVDPLSHAPKSERLTGNVVITLCKNVTPELLEKVYEYSQDNHHTLALWRIAKAFEYTAMRLALAEMICEQVEAGCLTEENETLRRDLRLQMFALIEHEHGVEVLAQIKGVM